jgi:ParB family chromosome partitioning protein
MTAVATPSKPERVPAPVLAGELRQIPLVELVESPWNPRKHFDPAKLAEMADSLRKGQLAPIIVRPTTYTSRGATAYEIGAGHRRFRAAPAAGLTSLLAIVRDMDDVTFLELLTIENKQRDDVTPLDEAAGFRLLMEKAGYDLAKLAARIGLSTKYVYDRLKLLQLSPEAKKLLEDGTITAGHAILLARLTPADQKRTIGNPNRINRYGYNDGTGLFQAEHAQDDPDQPGLELNQPVKARSVREVATWINDHVRFNPAQNDLPNLFPAAAVALKEAETDDLDPVYITHDHQLKFDAKDHKVRTYGVSSWRRADGTKKSKRCDWSRIGIVAAGRDRGDAFRVCVNRDKCDVHFQASARAAKRRKAADRARAVPADKTYTPTAAQKREQEKAQRESDLQELRDRLQDDVLATHKDEFLDAIASRAAPFKAVPADALLALMHDGEFWIPPATDWDEQIADVVGPSLPGKWRGNSRYPSAVKDAAAARSMIGLRLFLALDAKKLDAQLDREIEAAAEKALKAEATEAKALEKKPAPKKAKKQARG